MMEIILLLGLLSFPAGQDESGLIGAADQVLQKIVQLRQLELKKPVPKGVRNREEIREYVLQQLEDDYPAERLEKDRIVYVGLGLLDPKLDLSQLIVELLTDQIAGYYDPKSGMFYIADWIPESMQRPVMAHELMHALQDQHFDLERMLEAVKEDEDRLMALKSLIEGEGVAVMFDYMLEPSGKSFQNFPDIVELMEKNDAMASAASAVYARTPAFLKDLLMFPYSYGAAFVQFGQKLHDYAGISKVYELPPQSTEQILHPRKYFGQRDDPTVVPTFDTPSSLEGFERIHQGVLGEFTFFQILKAYLEVERARAAAEGWDGDRFQLFSNEQGQKAIMVRTLWDSDAEAREFFTAFEKVISIRFEDAGYERDSQVDAFTWRTGPHWIRLDLEGSFVTFLDSDLPRQ